MHSRELLGRGADDVGLAWPTLSVPMPPAKSMKTLPSTSVSEGAAGAARRRPGWSGRFPGVPPRRAARRAPGSRPGDGGLQADRSGHDESTWLAERRRAQPITRVAPDRARRASAEASEVVVPEDLALIRSAQRMTDGHRPRRLRPAAAPAAAPTALERVLGRCGPRPLHRLRHPDDRHPGLVRRDGVLVVLVVDHHDDGLLHPVRPDHRRARLSLAGRGGRLHLGPGGVRAALGLDGRLAVLDQQRHLGPVGLFDLRRHLRPDLPEDPLALAGGRDRDRPDLAHRRSSGSCGSRSRSGCPTSAPWSRR